MLPSTLRGCSALLRTPSQLSQLRTLIIHSSSPSSQPIASAVHTVLTSGKFAKFDETVSLSLNLNIDPRKPGQNIRGTVPLPFGLGKPVRILVLSGDSQLCAKALAAGATYAGLDVYLAKLTSGDLSFLTGLDRIITTPASMPSVAKAARVLGPRGLMPSPKTGSVTDDVVGALDSALRGEASIRCDKEGVVNAAVGKVSQGAVKLLGNIKAVLEGISDMKPETAKKGSSGKGGSAGGFMISCNLSRTMGGCGGVLVDIGTVDPTSPRFFRGGEIPVEGAAAQASATA